MLSRSIIKQQLFVWKLKKDNYNELFKITTSFSKFCYLIYCFLEESFNNKEF